VTGGAIGPAMAGLGVGIALASAPGPVQAVLLAESVTGGTGRGFRAQAGANLTLAVMLACLALGLSVTAPTGRVLALLQAAGGALLLLLAADGLRPAKSPAGSVAVGAAIPGTPTDGAPEGALGAPEGALGAPEGAPLDRAAPGLRPEAPRGLGTAGRRQHLPPAMRGVLAVLINPGSWLFLGAVAAPLLASAIQHDGTGGALLVALVTVIGCGSADTAVVLAGGLGVRRAGQRIQLWVRRALAMALAGLGCWFLAAGTISLIRH
jgi:threonine/homoserine/homoserine lactone efflux protein